MTDSTVKTVIQNAFLADPCEEASVSKDIVIENGRVESILPSFGSYPSSCRIVDATGKYLFPGFVDFHTHLFASGSAFGLDADRLISSGVTTAVDMGTAGWGNYDRFHAYDVEGKRIRIRSYLNIAEIGQPGNGKNESLEDTSIDIERIRAVVMAHPDEILGLKVRLSRNIVKDLGVRPLVRAVEIGEKLGLPVCVHTTDPPVPTFEIAAILRPGDIYCHVYQGRGNTILDDRGDVFPELIEAQKRGVVMEVGNGSANFDFHVAKAAIRQGLLPDIISSDSTVNTYHRNEAMWDLPHVMSKFVALGMPLEKVMHAATIAPADKLGLGATIGRIAPGYTADLVICDIVRKECVFKDVRGTVLTGEMLIDPVMTLIQGKRMTN